jgi:hypothetical protein
MENKSLNVFNSRLVLATPDTATDGDFARIEGGCCIPALFCCIFCHRLRFCAHREWVGAAGRLGAGCWVLHICTPAVAFPTLPSALPSYPLQEFGFSGRRNRTEPALAAGVVGHEYFHNYTGNRVTCRDWFQLTLKEGLTVYRDQVLPATCSAEHCGML